jgi:hypothetical protein
MSSSVQIGRGYWSAQSLRRRKAAIMAKLRKVDTALDKAAKVPPSRRLTHAARTARYRRVLGWRERAAAPASYREIGERLKVSSTRAQRIYLDAVNWRKNNGHSK